MRPKLQKFEQFARQLLPHEVAYLLSVQQFTDGDNLAILQRIQQACLPGQGEPDFDFSLDKRKYSNLKKWVQTRLEAIDVDRQFEQLNAWEAQIMTDSIQPEAEQALLDLLAGFELPYFYFAKLYALAKQYRHYLLIRMRYPDHQQVRDFLDRYEGFYRRVKEIDEQLYRITLDITGQLSGQAQSDPRQWEPWLVSLVFDDSLDGQNRYLAVVRLTFIYVHYRQPERLLKVYDYLDELFKHGTYYSRRLLLNYYANRLLLHAKLGDYPTAESFGYLSIRDTNTEYLQYVNNLASVLLRQKKASQALDLMQAAAPLVRQTKNFHNKTGFFSFYAKALLENGRLPQAEQYAEGFLRTHQTEIFSQRWHLFFSIYLQLLLRQEKYAKLLSVVHRHKLLDRLPEQQGRPSYLPSVEWYYLVAAYKEGKMGAAQVEAGLKAGLAAAPAHKQSLLQQLLDELYPHLPQLITPFKSTPLAS